MSALLVIPARGGSQGLPRKNVRLLAGKPLVCYVLETALTVPDATVCVVTDDDEVAAIAARYPEVTVLREPEELARPDVPLDPVVYWAAQQFPECDPIISLQPTSPYTTAATIARARACLEDDYDSAVTVVDDRHLRWDWGEHGDRPKRETRQQMREAWREIGAVFACRRAEMTERDRYGLDVKLLPITGREAVDIDTVEDWWVAEGYAHAKRILYRVDGGGALGLGHVYRALTLQHATFGHEVTFVMDPRNYPQGVALARAKGAPVVELPTGTDEEWTDVVDNLNPDVILCEIGATEAEAIQGLRDKGRFVVTIEDSGSGAAVADLTFNDLGSPEHHGPQRYQGLRYAVLREEFVGVPPAPWRETVERVLVTFGGTDPSGYCDMVVEALASLEVPRLDVVVGPAAEFKGDFIYTGNLGVYRGVRTLSPFACQADLAITSCGRTTYELAACRVPTLCLPQNAHERAHIPVALQLGARVIADPMAVRPHLAEAIASCFDAGWRRQARAQAARYDLTGGAQRFWDIVWRAYRERACVVPPPASPAFAAPCVEVA